MEQKVIQIGSSAGVTISKETLRELGVKIGDTVETEVNAETFVIKARSIPQVKLAGVAETVTRATAYIEKYRKDFEALANK
jgi:antitoxin component of MazEF toxin-antitoxin module